MTKKANTSIFILKKKNYLTPHYIRVVLSGDVTIFENTTIGDNNKIFIPPKGVAQVHLPELDAQNNSWIHPPKEVAPFIRTYTHRGIDLEKGELIIDFVNHGETGPASAWALHSKIGDELGVAMKTEPKELYPKEAEWFLLAGDTTAIPVLGAILEALRESAKGTCIIEAPSKEDEQILNTKAKIDFIWLYNKHPENGSPLAQKVKEIRIPNLKKFGYVACEFSSVKEIRTYLRKKLGWNSTELYAYSFWKSGVAEDKSVTDRQKEKKSIK